jgi:hypothetical protein
MLLRAMGIFQVEGLAEQGERDTLPPPPPPLPLHRGLRDERGWRWVQGVGVVERGREGTFDTENRLESWGKGGVWYTGHKSKICSSV